MRGKKNVGMEVFKDVGEKKGQTEMRMACRIIKVHEGGVKQMNGPKGRITAGHFLFLLLAVAAYALHPAAASYAGQKQPAIQQICGQELEVVDVSDTRCL
jgi:hypothetical protein